MHLLRFSGTKQRYKVAIRHIYLSRHRDYGVVFARFMLAIRIFPEHRFLRIQQLVGI